MSKNNTETELRNKKWHIGVMTEDNDRELISKGAKIQRRSIASFILESALIRAKQLLKEEEENDKNYTV